MAKTKEKPNSVGGYFRVLFRENPGWLKSKSNAQVRERWEKDHPGEQWTNRISGNMANVKSQLRKRLNAGKAPAKGGPRPAAPRTRPSGTLDKLEILIDDCLVMARQMNSGHLDKAVNYLRSARNAVVYQMGEP
jgi:hypothetical protein